MSDVVDAALEASVIGSFSRLGYGVRRRLGRWTPPGPDGALAGRTVLVTGATSGIGLAAAAGFARLGASVRLLARDEGRAELASQRVARAGGVGAEVTYDLVDMADFEAVRGFARRFSVANPRLDVLVHNAGALSRDFRAAPDGTELTLAAHVLGPFLLTSLLRPNLQRASPARVITVSSGGMYTQRFDLATLETGSEGYDGRIAYARAKRAQVVLNAEWARRVPAAEVVFHAMHPGWVDTPGVRTGLPGFHRVMGPVLRTPEEGADTVVWLGASAEALRSSGAFWHDRRRRGEHHLPWTRGSGDGPALWDFCSTRTEVGHPGIDRG